MPLAAAEVLEEVYLGAGEYRKLADAREVKVRFTEDSSDKVEMLQQLAEIYEIQLEDLGAAFGAFVRALPLDNRNELTLSSLERLAEVESDGRTRRTMILGVGSDLPLVWGRTVHSIFLGGGTMIELPGVPPTLFSDVPEWGAMLASGFRWFTAKPFIVFPPALAFFVAIVGFNTFGEGLRRLIERSYVDTSFLLRKRMLLVLVGISVATFYIITNTGPAPWFAKMANAFSGGDAYLHTQTLAQMNGIMNADLLYVGQQLRMP